MFRVDKSHSDDDRWLDRYDEGSPCNILEHTADYHPRYKQIARDKIRNRKYVDKSKGRCIFNKGW